MDACRATSAPEDPGGPPIRRWPIRLHDRQSKKSLRDLGSQRGSGDAATKIMPEPPPRSPDVVAERHRWPALRGAHRSRFRRRKLHERRASRSRVLNEGPRPASAEGSGHMRGPLVGAARRQSGKVFDAARRRGNASVSDRLARRSRSTDLQAASSRATGLRHAR